MRDVSLIGGAGLLVNLGKFEVSPTTKLRESGTLQVAAQCPSLSFNPNFAHFICYIYIICNCVDTRSIVAQLPVDHV